MKEIQLQRVAPADLEARSMELIGPELGARGAPTTPAFLPGTKRESPPPISPAAFFEMRSPLFYLLISSMIRRPPNSGSKGETITFSRFHPKESRYTDQT